MIFGLLMVVFIRIVFQFCRLQSYILLLARLSSSICYTMYQILVITLSRIPLPFPCTSGIFCISS
jgi:hypothetical protein